MPLYIQIVDDNGVVDPHATLGDVLSEQVLTKGVGFFRPKKRVARAIKTTVNELLLAKVIVVVPPAPTTVQCHSCEEEVGVWHSYPDGSNLCTRCKR